MKGSLSIRFPSVLTEEERGEVATILSSHGACVASWGPHETGSATFARVEYETRSPAEPIQRKYPEARIDDPALVILQVETSDENAQRLVGALGGPAGPVGVVAVTPTPSGVIVELDEVRTPLSLVADLIDVELALDRKPRHIRPLTGLPDRMLARFAGATLWAPDLDEMRLIEAYSEPLLQKAP